MKKTFFIITACLLAAVIMLQINSAEVSGDQKTVTLTGIDAACTDCSKTLDEVLQNIIGIHDYQIRPQQGELTITFNTDVMRTRWITRSLEASGFAVRDVHE